MNNRALASALSLFTLGGLSAGAIAVGTQGPGAAPVTAATVDIQHLFQVAPQMAAIKAELEVVGEGFKSRMTELEGKIKKAQILIEAKKEGSLEEAMAKLELRGLQAEYETSGDLFGQEFRRQEREKFVAFYEEIDQAIDVVVKRTNVDLVFRIRNMPKANAPLELKEAMLDAIEIWHANKRLDITKDVLRVLQAKAGGVDAAEAAAGGSSPTPGEGK